MSCPHDTDFLRLFRLRVPVYHKLLLRVICQIRRQLVLSRPPLREFDEARCKLASRRNAIGMPAVIRCLLLLELSSIYEYPACVSSQLRMSYLWWQISQASHKIFHLSTLPTD